jgi:hypothetical protein
MRIDKLSLLTLGLLTLFQASAADAVTDAITQAYAPYREALFGTNSRAQTESGRAIAEARSRWQALVVAYSKWPPPPYDRDLSFGQTLHEILTVYDQAALEIGQKKLAEAYETLERARDLLAELRRRNNVLVYSDHMNAYHAEMEQLLEVGPKMSSCGSADA